MCGRRPVSTSTTAAAPQTPRGPSKYAAVLGTERRRGAGPCAGIKGQRVFASAMGGRRRRGCCPDRRRRRGRAPPHPMKTRPQMRFDNTPAACPGPAPRRRRPSPSHGERRDRRHRPRAAAPESRRASPASCPRASRRAFVVRPRAGHRDRGRRPRRPLEEQRNVHLKPARLVGRTAPSLELSRGVHDGCRAARRLWSAPRSRGCVSLARQFHARSIAPSSLETVAHERRRDGRDGGPPFE